jgi:hypothetical protein
LWRSYADAHFFSGYGTVRHDQGMSCEWNAAMPPCAVSSTFAAIALKLQTRLPKLAVETVLARQGIASALIAPEHRNLKA